MQINRLIIILACVLGIIIGFMVPATKVVMDNHGVGSLVTFLNDYLFSVAGGQHLSVIFKLLAGTVGGMAFFGVLAVWFISRRNKSKLDLIYAKFDSTSHYVVSQRGAEAMVMAVVLFALSIAVLYIFKSMHTIGVPSTGMLGSNRVTSSIRFPVAALLAALTLCMFIVSGALITLFGALNYGRYEEVPIGLENDVLSFFKCFFGLSVIAIDQPVSINLNHAEVDFKTQGGKGFLYVYNANSRLVISPKLDFVNGSFDELADYVERFAVREDE